MKLDIDERNSYDADKLALIFNVDVYFNGVAQKYCTMADEENGVIERFVIDDNGRTVRDGDEIKRERLHGRVVIKDRRLKRSPLTGFASEPA